MNPANMAYDPDARWALMLDRDPMVGGATSIAATAGVQSFGLGVQHVRDTNGRAEWSVDVGAAIPLPKRLAIGSLVRWHLEDDARNHVAWDAGVAWRPLPWFGLAAVTRNLGNPDRLGDTVPEAGAGLAVRPFGRALLVGADLIRSFGNEPTLVFRGSARVRPAKGLYLRASADTHGRIGGGLEVYFGGAGIGAHVSSGLDPGTLSATTWLGSDEPGEALFHSSRRVGALFLEEEPPYRPGAALLGRPEASWLEVLEHLRVAAEERSMAGMVLTVGDAPLSWSRAAELRDAIERIEQAGKPVAVYLQGNPGNSVYFAASAASQVFLHPAADLNLGGLGMELTYMGDALDRLGIRAESVKRSEYKAAPEPLELAEPSDAQREQLEAVLDDMEEELVRRIAAGRHRPEETARTWLHDGPWTGEEAAALGMVDALAYPDELDGLLNRALSTRVDVIRYDKRPQPHSAWEPPAQIAVVYVDAPIVRGESSGGGLLQPATTGSRTVVDQLARARRRSQVRAVVLRVDSPGGSALASDEIWRAVARLRASGKPVVVSMGDVAASGGYYVASGADAIWAHPMTLTGSIGVFRSHVAIDDLLAPLGVHTTWLSRGEHAHLDSMIRPWSDADRARLEVLIGATYDRFRQRVASGRGLSMDRVEELARGRVWTGKRAAEQGLVDHLGGLEDAIADARARAGLGPRTSVTFVSLDEPSSVLEILASSLLPRPLRGGAAAEVSLAPSLAAGFGRTAILLAHPEESTWLWLPWELGIGPR